MASSDDSNVWSEMPEVSSEEAAYLLRGYPPVTYAERRHSGEPMPAAVVAMRRRLLNDKDLVPYRDTSRTVPGEWRGRSEMTQRWFPPVYIPGEKFYRRTDLEAWAARNGVRLLYQAGELKSSERDKLLKHVGALALALAEKSKRYQLGDKPNAKQIADAAVEILKALPDANTHGVGASSIRDSIRAGIQLFGVLPE